MSTAIFVKDKKRPNGRLLVGYRRGTWTKVWYEPIEGAEPDADGTIAIGLFSLSTGGAQRREPMEGEVAWLPHFELKTFESIRAKERERKQMQFLYDAWRYFNESDPDKLEELNEELHQPEDRRWTSFFDDAKLHKKTQGKVRRRRKAKRVETLRTANIDPADVDVNSDTSDDDPTYASDGEDRNHSRAKPRTPMGPPGPGPFDIDGPKRRAAGRSDPQQRGPKRQRQDLRGSLEADEQSLFMSGGIGTPDHDDFFVRSRSSSERPPGDSDFSREFRGPSQFSEDVDNSAPTTPPPGAFLIGRSTNRTSADSGIERSHGGSGHGFSPINPCGSRRTPAQQEQNRSKFKKKTPQSGTSSGSLGSLPHQEVNGGMDEAEALERAMRASMEPQSHPFPTPGLTPAGFAAPFIMEEADEEAGQAEGLQGANGADGADAAPRSAGEVEGAVANDEPNGASAAASNVSETEGGIANDEANGDPE